MNRTYLSFTCTHSLVQIFVKVRCGLAHLPVKDDLSLDAKTCDENFDDIRHLVKILEDKKYFTKPKAEDIKDRLSKVM